KILAKSLRVAKARHWTRKRNIFKKLTFPTELSLKELILDIDELLRAGDCLQHGALAVCLYATALKPGKYWQTDRRLTATDLFLIEHPLPRTTQHLHADTAGNGFRIVGQALWICNPDWSGLLQLQTDKVIVIQEVMQMCLADQ